MKLLAAILALLSLAFAQDTAPAAGRVEWNASAPEALKELPDGRAQRTVNTKAATVSIIADVVPARRFVDPPADAGQDVTYVVIGIRNISPQAIHIDPNTFTLRTVGKKEKQLSRLTEEKVIERAWPNTDNRPGTLPAMSGSMSGYGNTRGPEASIQTATTQDPAGRTVEASARNTGAQAAKLRDKALLPRELAPGESVMGMVFFSPYEKKDHLELALPVGENTFVFAFDAKKK